MGGVPVPPRRQTVVAHLGAVVLSLVLALAFSFGSRLAFALRAFAYNLVVKAEFEVGKVVAWQEVRAPS